MILLIPGLWNSGPENPQSYWERERGDCVRVVQRDWETPVCAEWVETLEKAVVKAPPGVVLSAHSLGCALVAHWARTGSVERVRGALLVAPSDVESPNYPKGTTGFKPMPLQKLPFRTLVAASSDDVWVSMERARQYAAAWGAELVECGPIGHINADSKIGRWRAGEKLLESLL